MVYIIILSSIIAVLIFGVSIFRRDSNRSGIRNDIDSARKINTGLGRIGESQDRVKEGLEKLGENNSDAQRRTEDIGKHNKSATTRVQSAIEILKRAKKRTDNSGS